MEIFGHYKREFLESFLKLENGIPSHDTLSRVLGKLDPEAFQWWFLGFMGQFAQGVVAVDGKILRRSYDRAEGQAALHPVGAWAEDRRLALGQLAVDDKSNEITALPRLLEMLTLPDTVVTPIFDESRPELPASDCPAKPAPYLIRGD